MVKNNNLFWLWILVSIAILMVVAAFYLSFRVLEVETIESSFLVGDRAGFDLNLTALTLGQIAEGHGGSRGISLVNDHEKPIKIEISSNGEITDYLSLSENNFILLPGEGKSVTFNVYAPKGLEKKTYSGKIEIKTLRLFL